MTVGKIKGGEVHGSRVSMQSVCKVQETPLHQPANSSLTYVAKEIFEGNFNVISVIYLLRKKMLLL